MNLYEFEGKQLLAQYGFSTPKAQLFSYLPKPEEVSFSGPYVLKAQILQGNRAAKGGILLASNFDQLRSKIKSLLHQQFDREVVESVLVEQQIKFEQEFFLSLTFSTDTRTPVLLFSNQGGSGIEQRDDRLKIYPLSISHPQFPSLPIPQPKLHQLWQLFTQEDARLVEINPLVKTKSGNWLALDAKVVLDETAFFRHPHRKFKSRSLLHHQPTPREIKAKQVDQMDHRGSAGATYFDFGAGVGVLASGGGASIIVMDTLLANHLHPANYTEYSGNPTREKVKALTEVVLSHDLNSLLVVGGNANFTDIYETLMGVMDAVLAQKPLPTFPIVIRRGGPRWQEAFEALEKLKQHHRLNLHLFGPDVPMTFAVSHLVKLLNQEKN